MQALHREIRYETDRNPTFADEIRKTPGCELIDRCIQCATCSGICPLSIYMDYTPRRVIELTRSGFKDDVLSCNTIWLCASCYACQVECPKLIGITDIMYALKSKAIAEGTYPKHLPIPVLAHEFTNMVRQTGRVSEGRLVARLYRKSSLLTLLRLPSLGYKLLRAGRLSFKKETMRRPERLRKLLDASKEASR